ncbi:N-acetylglucosamine kinase [Rhizobium sp. CFBP 8762]|uniref:N-acetylglucosamine kinase n=1 Tax=Rhizobium sp. CFBP 8762 TaxID=2775279 RepID=UPI001781A08F|nr:BadF/BadG/BcrA/BcrD ATPase family protein [Rhizobium sp. CFBP 8762]MBD8556016.1 N-acetylglucosamine kinase [Rhizobium sp. CFBP 8762]
MIVGVDIGGTKTHIAALSADKVRSETKMLTAQWRYRRDPNADVTALVDLICKFAGGNSPEVLVVGAHGCDTDRDCQALQALIATHLQCTVSVINDSEVLPAAAGKETGISVICGTGSIAVTRDSDRRMIAAGGWGWFLGDEASAAGLVRDAARCVRRALDLGRPLDCLGTRLLNALAIDNPVELGRALSDLGSAAQIGQHAPLVFEAATAGSDIANDVIVAGGVSLARLVARLIARGATTREVVAAGGVITKQPALFKAFRAALADQSPDCTLTLLTEPPVSGALALARTLQAGHWPKNLPLPHIGNTISHEADWRAE